VSRRSLLAATLTVAGLALFLAVQPTVESRDPQHITEWLPGLALVAVVALAALGVALAGPGRARSLGLGAAAGTTFALSAALVKTWGEILGAGGVRALATSWELWTALGFGLVGALLSQAAFQSGPLGGPLAAMMVVDPVTGVSLGAIVFGESFSTGLMAVVQAAGLALTLTGVWLLATVERRLTTDTPPERSPLPQDLERKPSG
jgi:hypothetical protein